MVDCGIKKYDVLPSRVGLIDVDYLRWRLLRCDRPLAPSIIGWLLTPPNDSETRKQIIKLLEEARREVK